MINQYNVIIRPLMLTEKGEVLKETQNKILFEVAMRSNKEQIKGAVEKLFKVRVLEVNTSIVRGKMARIGRTYSKKPNWKKAIVTLREGDSIDFSEGV